MNTINIYPESSPSEIIPDTSEQSSAHQPGYMGAENDPCLDDQRNREDEAYYNNDAELRLLIARIRHEIALIIDLRVYKMDDIPVFVASVTRTGERADWLVLRQAFDLGKLKDIVQHSLPLNLIVLGEYKAKQSGGYSYQSKNHDLETACVVGAMGEKFRAKSLRILGKPAIATIVPGPVYISKLSTHTNSNLKTTVAALEGFRLYDQICRDRQLRIITGQSDQASAYELKSDASDRRILSGMPLEHHDDIDADDFDVERPARFTEIKVAESVLKNAAYHRLNDGKFPKQELSQEYLHNYIKFILSHRKIRDYFRSSCPDPISVLDLSDETYAALDAKYGVTKLVDEGDDGW